MIDRAELALKYELAAKAFNAVNISIVNKADSKIELLKLLLTCYVSAGRIHSMYFGPDELPSLMDVENAFIQSTLTPSQLIDEGISYFEEAAKATELQSSGAFYLDAENRSMNGLYSVGEAARRFLEETRSAASDEELKEIDKILDKFI